MKILVIGKGHLGTFLKQRLNPALHYTGVLDHIEKGMLDEATVVVNTVGKTSLEFCESNPLAAWSSNVIQPLNLLRKIKDQLLIQISSGCVWDGPYDKHLHAFRPDSPVSPACFYSWTKSACDAMMLREAHGKYVSILRPRQVYSPVASERNTLTKLRRYSKLIDTPNSMTSAETIARTIEYMASHKNFALNGLINNVYDMGVTSPYEVGMLLYQAGLRDEPEKLTKTALDVTLKPRRVDTVLYDQMFELEVCPPKVQDELKRVIKEYAAT
jgi:dTDP-4-dehydrorhamnose reductase